MVHPSSAAVNSGVMPRRTFLTGGMLAGTFAGLARAQTAEDTVLTFGVVADVHYAQLYPDGERYYKGSLQKLQEAIDTFRKLDVDFVIELGDFIDSGGDKKEEVNNLHEIDAVFRTFPKQRYYVLGNHDLQRFTKKEFLKLVNQPQSRYSFDINGVHCIVLDACFNPDGSDYKSGRFDWTKSFIPQSVLGWLEVDIQSADGRPVIVFTHQILHRDGSRHCVLNAPAVRAILESHGNVRAVFSGHQHFNTHVIIGGIHYLTLAAMVNGRPPTRNTYAVVYLKADGGVVVDGFNQRDYQW